MRQFLIGLFFVLVIGGGALAMWWVANRPVVLKNPLSSVSYVNLRDSLFPSNQEKRVLGFLPYWNMKEASKAAELTDVAYFSISLGPNGKLVERDADGNADLGLSRLQGKDFEAWSDFAQANKQRLHITVTMFDNEEISSFLLSDAAQQQAISTLKQLVASYPFAGVAMDIEFGGEADDVLRRKYAEFLAKLRSELRKADSGLELSVAVYGSAASRPLLWDIKAIEPSIDFLIVMAYDYHVRSSSVVGPVAPIFGRGQGRWEHDVVSNMRDIIAIVPPRKVLLGIPFYGYEWTAVSEELGANTYPDSGATATYKRVVDILKDPKLKAEERWDEDALAPYVTYKEGGRTQFIYYENSRSLSYKLDFIEQVDLAGMAIWALGYEGAHPELWQVIHTKFEQK